VTGSGAGASTRRAAVPGAAAPDRLSEAAPALRQAAARFGTPVAVTDVATLEAAAAAVTAAFPDPWLRAFSLKANDVVPIVRRIGSLGFGGNVVSRGEWAIASRAGIPNERITLEGVGKSDGDLRAAIRSAREGRPLRWIAIESLDEAAALARLARVATRRDARRRQAGDPTGGGAGTGVPLDVLFRLNPAVNPDTHAGLAVGTSASKFGMTADEVTAALEVVAETPGLRARGLHLHVGSQLRTVDAWREGVRRALALFALVRGSRPELDTLDVGGGIPVLPAGEPAPDPARFARELPALLAAIPADRRPSRLAVEPGRALVARAGFLVGRVLHVRERGGRQVILDLGMTDLIRPALYGARHEIVALTSLGRPLDRPRTAPGSPARVEGPICESTDSFGEHALPPLRRGDIVAILDSGAYAASLASAYNGRPRPPQVLLEPDGRLLLGRPRASLRSLG
jgi:diaminopimelate decarboxylase